MSKSENISVVSTYATDRLIDASTLQVKSEQRGGPVLYLLKALKLLNLNPQVFTAEDMLVEILVREDDEFGKIHTPKKKTLLPQIDTPYVIISTLLDEWDLSSAHDYKGKMFVDVQGYVRDGSAFGKKKEWENIEKFAKYIFCLKGNDVEIGMLPKEVTEDQKQNRMLIITKDAKGVEIYYKANLSKFAPKILVRPPNTIGAGDTWFANFVAKFTETENVEKSAVFALDKTSEFLKNIK